MNAIGNENFVTFDALVYIDAERLGVHNKVNSKITSHEGTYIEVINY